MDKLDGYCERHGITKGEAIRKGVVQMLRNEHREPKVFHVERKDEPPQEPRRFKLEIKEAPKQEPQRMVFQIKTTTSDEVPKELAKSVPQANTTMSWKHGDKGISKTKK